MIVKRVGVLSCGAVFAGTGIVVGFFYGMMGAVTSLSILMRRPGEGVLAIAFMLLLMPALFAGGAFLSGLFWAFLYNTAANMFGGLEIELIESAIERYRKQVDVIPNFDLQAPSPNPQFPSSLPNDK